jgi:uncharacterized iron-regulated membrane protein
MRKTLLAAALLAVAAPAAGDPLAVSYLVDRDF